MAKGRKKGVDPVGAAKGAIGKLPDVTAVPTAISTTVKRVRRSAPTAEEIEDIVRRVVREELGGRKRKRG
jgi:hypothetical protein